MFFRQLIAALASSCLICAAYAENIKTIEVVADKIEPRSVTEVNLDDYNGFESVVTRASFENRLVNLAELINAMPSVQTFSTGGMGGYTSASIRGSTGKQVNIFVDGILLNSPASGYSNLGIIPTSIIEAIEVFPDYTPVQLSDGNLAGAINIRTRQTGSKGNGGKVSLGYGSFSTRKAEASLWGGNAETSALIAGSMLASENNFPVSAALFPNLSAGQSQRRENAAFAQSDLFGKLRHALNDGFELQAMLNYANSHNEIPTIQNKTETPATLDADNFRSSIGIESVNIDHNWGVRLYSNAGSSRFKDLKRSIALNARHVNSEENTLGSTLYLESALAGHLLAGSVDISQTRIEKHNQLGSNEKIRAGRDKLVLAISDSWTPLPAFSLYGMARQYYLHDETDPGTASFAASCPGNDAHCLASTHQETSLQLGARQELGRNWGIKANIGKLLRMPTLAEKYGDTGNYIGDPRLLPEFSNSADAGLFFRSTPFRAELVVFGREVENGIYISYDARGVGHPANISESSIAGIEFDGEWFILSSLSLSLSGYNMGSENLSSIKADRGKKVQGIYHNGYIAALSWNRHIHSLSTSYQMDDELYYTASNSVKADRKDSWNINYTATVEAWIFNFAINNILDNQYSDFNRMPSSGRSVNGNIHYEF